jgi:hypothetical protein
MDCAADLKIASPDARGRGEGEADVDQLEETVKLVGEAKRATRTDHASERAGRAFARARIERRSVRPCAGRPYLCPRSLSE